MDPQASDLYERIGASREEPRERLEQRAHRATAEYHRRRHRTTGDARQELLSAVERVEEAASVLTDPQRRRAYDRQREDDCQTDRTARERSTADRGSTSLRIEIEPRSPSPGETVAIRTTDAAERPVSGVDVRIEYDETEQTVTTDRDGRKRLRFTSPQEVRLTAEKGTIGGRSYESAVETMVVGDAAETERAPSDADDTEAEPDRRGEKRPGTTDDATNATEAPSPGRETAAFEGKSTNRPGDADGSHGSPTIHLHHAAGIVGIAVVGIATAVGWATAVPLVPAAAGAGILSLTLYLIAREAATAGR